MKFRSIYLTVTALVVATGALLSPFYTTIVERPLDGYVMSDSGQIERRLQSGFNFVWPGSKIETDMPPLTHDFMFQVPSSMAGNGPTGNDLTPIPMDIGFVDASEYLNVHPEIQYTGDVRRDALFDLSSKFLKMYDMGEIPHIEFVPVSEPVILTDPVSTAAYLAEKDLPEHDLSKYNFMCWSVEGSYDDAALRSQFMQNVGLDERFSLFTVSVSELATFRAPTELPCGFR